MKNLVIILLLLPSVAFASSTPYSGTFSNASEEYREHLKPTLRQKINLVVTVNENGQQFFVQCFNGDNAGFGVVTNFKKPRIHAVIDAGPECPSETLSVELDYEEAYIRTDNGWAHLMRGNIYVPIKD